jgi:hypothetical protein
MSFSSTHYYPAKELTGDYLRGGAGAALCATPLVIADSVTVASYFLWPLVVLFGGFVVRTGLKQFTWIAMEPEGIRTAGIWRKEIRWEEIRRIKMRYFSTKRDRTDGWMQVKVTGAGGALAFDSTVTGFDDLARRLAEAGVVARAEMDETTRANFELMGISLVDLANDGPGEEAG